MRMSKVLFIAAAAFISTGFVSQSYACINGSAKCLTHMVYVCSGGWWVVTQGVCHSDEMPEDKFALLHGSHKIIVNYSVPAQNTASQPGDLKLLINRPSL